MSETLRLELSRWNTLIVDELICDAVDLTIDISEGKVYTVELNKDQAIQLIQHLKEQFSL